MVGKPFVSDLDMVFGVEGLSTSLWLVVRHMLLLGEFCRDGFSLSRVFCVFSIDGSISIPLSCGKCL